jgi:hypothetical protein
MFREMKLSEAEWNLVVELLECEHEELPVEIRHTRAANVRKELQERAHMVRQLLERLASEPVAI